jgi:hypothetical protein
MASRHLRVVPMFCDFSTAPHHERTQTSTCSNQRFHRSGRCAARSLDAQSGSASPLNSCRPDEPFTPGSHIGGYDLVHYCVTATALKYAEAHPDHLHEVSKSFRRVTDKIPIQDMLCGGNQSIFEKLEAMLPICHNSNGWRHNSMPSLSESCCEPLRSETVCVPC